MIYSQGFVAILASQPRFVIHSSYILTLSFVALFALLFILWSIPATYACSISAILTPTTVFVATLIVAFTPYPNGRSSLFLYNFCETLPQALTAD